MSNSHTVVCTREQFDEHSCRCCRQFIPVKATICIHCGHHQNRMLDYVGFANVIDLSLARSILQYRFGSPDCRDEVDAKNEAQSAPEKVT